MGEFRADVEEPTRDVRVSGRSGRLSNASVREVSPGDAFNIRRNGEVVWCLGPSLRALEEHPHESHDDGGTAHAEVRPDDARMAGVHGDAGPFEAPRDRKSTRLNSSHQIISYAVFCLKKKKINNT